VSVEGAVRPLAVQLGQRRLVRAGAGDHHVVDRRGQPGEEPLERGWVGGVEGRGAAGADFGRGLLQPIRAPGGQDDLGPLGAGPAGGLQPDAPRCRR